MHAKNSSSPKDSNNRSWRPWLWAGAVFSLLLASLPAFGQITFVVNSLGDDGQEAASSGLFCFTGNTVPPQVPECTLRAALESANDADEPVTIIFSQSIPTTNGDSQIPIESGLPFIENQVTIDGSTHPSYQGIGDVPLRIRYTGPSSSTVSGIRFASNGGGSGSTVNAIGILSFTGSGILLNGGGGYTISNNAIGSVWTGTGVAGGGIGNHGIDVNGASGTGSNTIIRDNVISNVDGNGIHLRGGAQASFIFNNIFGLRRSGSTVFAPTESTQIQGAGVNIAANAGPDNFIGALGANVIANANGGGVVVRAPGQNITRNLIGLPPNFQTSLGFQLSDYGNGDAAIILESSDNIVGGAGSATNFIGNSPAEQIRIGNSGSSPIAANNNQIRRNLIGVTPNEDDVGSEWGVRIDNGDNTSIRNAVIANHTYNITARGSGNVIQRNTLSNANQAGIEMLGTGQIGSENANDANLVIGSGVGIWVRETGTGITHIRNNFIGVNEDGADLGNAFGIVVSQPGNLVNIFENTIGFNDYGIRLFQSTSGTWIQGNRIGELADGTAAPNAIGVWIRADDAQLQAVDHLIGGSINTDLAANPQLGNIIANSSSYGVRLDQASGGNLERVTVRGNVFRNNAEGISFRPEMNEIDPGGGQDGPNRRLNWPEFDSAETSLDPVSGELHYRVRVNTTSANASYPLFIDFYRHSGDAAAQGEVYLGSLVYQGSTAAQWFDGTLAPITPLAPGDQIVATASDSAGNTSQFTLNPVTLQSAEPLPDEIFEDRFEQD